MNEEKTRGPLESYPHLKRNVISVAIQKRGVSVSVSRFAKPISTCHHIVLNVLWREGSREKLLLFFVYYIPECCDQNCGDQNHETEAHADTKAPPEARKVQRTNAEKALHRVDKAKVPHQCGEERDDAKPTRRHESTPD